MPSIFKYLSFLYLDAASWLFDVHSEITFRTALGVIPLLGARCAGFLLPNPLPHKEYGRKPEPETWYIKPSHTYGIFEVTD